MPFLVFRQYEKASGGALTRTGGRRSSGVHGSGTVHRPRYPSWSVGRGASLRRDGPVMLPTMKNRGNLDG